MSKSLYQYRIYPEHRQHIEMLLHQILPTHKYKPSKQPNVFVCGSGWITAKRKIEYSITGDMLNICVWKVIAPIIPMLEMGCNDANSFYGAALNSGMKNAVEHTVNLISQQVPLTPLTYCVQVDDNFLDSISYAYRG